MKRNTVVVIVLVALIALAVGLVAIRRSSNPPLGKHCIVQVRPGLLGVSHAVSVGPEAENHNGTQTSVRGVMIRCNSEWVAVRRDDLEVWVPRSSVLAIYFENHL